MLAFLKEVYKNELLQKMQQFKIQKT